MEKMTSTMILNKYFGRKAGQGLGDFANELRQLSKEEKHDLAELAARELGVELMD